MNVTIEHPCITVSDLSIVDEEAAQALADVAEADRPNAVSRALKVGLIVLRDVVPIAKADFVRKEFERLKCEIEAYWKGEVREKLDATLCHFFDRETGALPASLQTYLGENGSLRHLFDERNTEGVPYRLRAILEKELTGSDSTFLRALDTHDQRSPLGRFAKEITDRLDEIKNSILSAKAAEAIADRGPQKGAPFEEMLYPALERVARVFGDVVEDIHNQNRAGDFLIHVNVDAVPGHSVKLALDAKDSKLNVPQSERVLEECKKNWNAASAILVFAKNEQTPTAVVNPFGRLAQGYACVLDKDSGDTQILEAAYRFARLDAVRSVQRSLGAVEPAVVSEKIEQAAVKLCELTTVKKRISNVRKLLDELWSFVGAIQNDTRDLLDEAWKGLGISQSLPQPAGETNQIHAIEQ